MVLSLGFIIAFIGAAVALLVGITIFSSVEEALICPAGSTTTGFATIGGFNNLGTLGDAGDAFYYDSGSAASFVVNSTGLIGQSAIDNGTDDGNTDAQIEFGTDPTTWNFLSAGGVGSNLTSVNLWVNGDLVGAFHYPILGNINCENGEPGWCVEANSGPTRVRVAENTTNIIDNASNGGPDPDDDGQWHMVTVLMDKGNTTGSWIEICIDSVCKPGGAQNMPFRGIGPFTPQFNLTAGGGETARGDHITFGVQNTINYDEVAIWNGYQLTQANINSLYNSGSGAVSSSVASSNLRLYVSFDAGTEFDTTGGTTTGGQGSDECEQAKDTAWTVIGIIPVALFFALFAIFGALGRTS